MYTCIFSRRLNDAHKTEENYWSSAVMGNRKRRRTSVDVRLMMETLAHTITFTPGLPASFFNKKKENLFIAAQLELVSCSAEQC